LPPGVHPPPRIEPTPAAPGQPGQPGQPAQPGEQPIEPTRPTTEAFAQAPEAGTQPAASANPVIFGDQGPSGLGALGGGSFGGGLGGGGFQGVPSGAGFGGTPSGGLGGTPTSAVSSPQSVRGNIIAALAASPFQTATKISENESPAPGSRAFIAYNFFSSVDRAALGPGIPVNDLHRELVGLEGAFLDGDASIGLRLPIFQLTGSPDFEDSHIGDLSILFKYALYRDRHSGNLLCAGMVLSTPTGQGVQVAGQSTINPVLFQPFVGYILNGSRCYLQGFTSVQVPTDWRDVTLLFNDAAVGYWLYRSDNPGDCLSGVVPDLELHVNTPLNHRGTDHTPLGFPDTVDVTAGSYFVFRRAVLGLAVGFPVTGPKPFDVEAIANLNFRF
jgi:hypothetical protein